MRYKAGDKVRVRDWDDMVKEFGICGENITIPGCYFVELMKKYCNCIVTISELSINGKYLVKEDENVFYWCDEMFEPLDPFGNALDEMMKKINQYTKEISEMKKEIKPKKQKQKTKRERLEEKIAKYQADSGIRKRKKNVGSRKNVELKESVMSRSQCRKKLMFRRGRKLKN